MASILWEAIHGLTNCSGVHGKRDGVIFYGTWCYGSLGGMKQIYKNKEFAKWAAGEGIEDGDLCQAVAEIEKGLIDADLGGNVLKKRVSLAGRGKRGGVRTLIAYRHGDKAFFVYGFAKNVRANIQGAELKALKAYARVLLGYGADELRKAIKAGALIKIEVEDGG